MYDSILWLITENLRDANCKVSIVTKLYYSFRHKWSCNYLLEDKYYNKQFDSCFGKRCNLMNSSYFFSKLDGFDTANLSKYDRHSLCIVFDFLAKWGFNNIYLTGFLFL